MDIDKIVIREARVDDAAGIIAFRQQVSMEPGIGIATDPGEIQYTVEREEDVIRNYQEMENSALMVAVTPEGEIVGLVGCMGGRRRSTAHETSLGITLKMEYRDKGLGTRVMQAALDWARSSGVIKRVQLEVFTNNERAIHLYEKLGFEQEGIRRKAYKKDGKWMDAIVMALFLD